MPFFVATASLILAHVTGTDTYTPPSTAYALLLRAVPSGHETGSQLAALEVAATDYAPVEIPWDGTMWSVPDDVAVVDQILDVIFATTTGGYEDTISAIAIRDGNTGTDADTPMLYKPSNGTITPGAGETPAFSTLANLIQLGLRTGA